MPRKNTHLMQHGSYLPSEDKLKELREKLDGESGNFTEIDEGWESLGPGAHIRKKFYDPFSGSNSADQ